MKLVSKFYDDDGHFPNFNTLFQTYNGMTYTRYIMLSINLFFYKLPKESY